MTQLCIESEVLSPAERRDLANALLSAAWAAAREDRQIVLLDLLIELSDSALGDRTCWRQRADYAGASDVLRT